MPIPKPIPTEILPENLREHRAVKAWSRLEPRCVGPEKIEILKLKTKTVVYRLVGLGPGGSAVIASDRSRITDVFQPIDVGDVDKILPGRAVIG